MFSYSNFRFGHDDIAWLWWNSVSAALPIGRKGLLEPFSADDWSNNTWQHYSGLE